jgi:hypothetical protein
MKKNLNHLHLLTNIHHNPIKNKRKIDIGNHVYKHIHYCIRNNGYQIFKQVFTGALHQ